MPGSRPRRRWRRCRPTSTAVCRRLGLPSDPKKFVPHVTLARLRQPRIDDVAHYLAGRGDFRTPAFPVGRFVLYSSRESVGGGPYVREESYPLRQGTESSRPRDDAAVASPGLARLGR